MKLRCGPTPEERHQAVRDKMQAEIMAAMEWHDVFAWWPRQVASGDCRWLETVQRRVLLKTSITGAVAWHAMRPYTDWRRDIHRVEYRAKPL